MKKDEFIRKTIEIIKRCENADYPKQITGFKLSIEQKNIISTTITTQVLLIFEQLFGSEFIYNNNIKDKFEFDNIKKYLLCQKNYFLGLEDGNCSQIHVNRCAYCGIGLLLLKEKDAASELADFLCRHRFDSDFSWGLKIGSSSPDILSTYIVTMLLNRLHRSVSMPSFVNDLINKCDISGIPYNNEKAEFKYIEALTIAIYIQKFYYKEPIDEEKIKLINEYYLNGKESICKAKENFFQEHPDNQWRIYGFGLAARIVSDYSNPFYNFIFEDLTPYFNKLETNIPYILELCRMYNAIVNNIDLFKENSLSYEIHNIKDEVKNLNELIENKVENLETQIFEFQKYNREVNIKIPIATSFTIIYFLLIGFLSFISIRFIADKILNIENLDGFFYIIEAVFSVSVPMLGFIIKKTRIYLVKSVDWFYQKFNVHKDDENK